VRVTPGPGSKVKPSATVKLVVSQGPKPAATVKIPDGLAGQPLTTVQGKLEDLGLKVVVDPTKVYSDTVKKGSVASVSPDEGATVKAGSTVTLVVSQGPKSAATVKIPDGLAGQPLATVQAKLKALGLKAADPTTAYSDDVPKGSVVSTTPGTGTTVKVGSTVQVVVSQGPEPVTIPDGLVGQDSDAVKGKLTDLGLVVVVTQGEKPSDTPAGDVLSLTPGEGSEVVPGSTVTIVVSPGPGGSEPTPTPTDTPTATPTGDTATSTPTSTPTGGTTDPAVTPTEAAREADTE
jgi:serine/threonine-protein kinase